jgi:pyruvate ferredoxin oxidoreductase alpha subunit
MAALSVAIGSQAAGVRSYTATSSQGLLYMMESVYNASGLELPIVMTLGNRAIGAPINIWNDHSDAMSARDAGWIMLFAETNQEAADIHIQAFKIAEKSRCPVMVCVDGFILTHAYERVDLPLQEDVDSFLEPYETSVKLDVKNPMAIGTMVPPESFMEVRYIAHKKQFPIVEAIDCIGKEFEKKFGRSSGGLVRKYNTDNAETIIITMGSIAGTIKDTVDKLNSAGGKFGVLSIISYRPLPAAAIKDVIKTAKKVVVVEKALAVGLGGILSMEIELLAKDLDVPVYSVIAGLGGKSITMSMLEEYFSSKKQENCVFLGLNEEIIQQESSSISTACCSKCSAMEK